MLHAKKEVAHNINCENSSDYKEPNNTIPINTTYCVYYTTEFSSFKYNLILIWVIIVIRTKIEK